MPLLCVDPDQSDHRAPRSINTLPINWMLVLHAVRYAISQLPTEGAAVLKLSSLKVAIPFPLTAAECELAQSWVGDVAPVTHWYEEGQVCDGRHRLWLTNPHHQHYFIPVFANSLYYLQDSRDGRVSREIMAKTASDSVAWWEKQSTEFQNLAATHRNVLARVYLEATAPHSLPRDWFDRVTDPAEQLVELVELHLAGRAGPDLLREILPQAWRNKQDEVSVKPLVVAQMFESIGFTVDGQPGRATSGGPLTLYRGAIEANKAGVSWTLNRQIAEHFARVRQPLHSSGKVWVAVVPRDQLRAYFSDEQEFIVDFVGLEHTIKPA